MTSRSINSTLSLFVALAVAGCSGPENPDGGSGGSTSTKGGASGNNGGSTNSSGGSTNNNTSGGSNNASGGNNSGGNGNQQSGGTSASMGGSFSGGSSSGGGNSTSGGSTNGGSTNGGTTSVGGSNSGGAKASGGSSSGGATGTGGAAKGGTTSTGGTGAGGTTAKGGTTSTGGTGTGGTGTGGTGTGGTTGSYACNGTTTGYDATVIKNGSTWTVTRNGSVVTTKSDMSEAMIAGWNSLTANRTTKQSVLVQGDGDIPATAQISMPSYLILNVCGTINVSGTPSGSDRSPIYARGKRDIDIPNLKMTGSPQYGIFFRLSDNIHLGNIELSLTSAAGVGIRVDNHPSNGTVALNQNFSLDSAKGTGMGSHIVETYGINNIKIGTVTGKDVGECGLLLNRSTNAEVDLVSCDNCGQGTGYAAFRIANDAGKIGSDWPAGNIHVKKVYARAGGNGIFSVSGSGGLTIDQIDVANVGANPILLQNCYNTTIATQSGTVSGGEIRISNDKKAIDESLFAPTQNVAIKNLVLSNGASGRQDYCDLGRRGCTVTNVTGGTISLCP